MIYDPPDRAAKLAARVALLGLCTQHRRPTSAGARLPWSTSPAWRAHAKLDCLESESGGRRSTCLRYYILCCRVQLCWRNARWLIAMLSSSSVLAYANRKRASINDDCARPGRDPPRTNTHTRNMFTCIQSVTVMCINKPLAITWVHRFFYSVSVCLCLSVRPAAIKNIIKPFQRSLPEHCECT